jgi:hypothetical protein
MRTGEGPLSEALSGVLQIVRLYGNVGPGSGAGGAATALAIAVTVLS